MRVGRQGKRELGLDCVRMCQAGRVRGKREPGIACVKFFPVPWESCILSVAFLVYFMSVLLFFFLMSQTRGYKVCALILKN